MPLDPQVAAFYGDSLNTLPDMSAVTVEGTRQAVDAFHNDKAQSPAVYSVQDKSIPCPWGEMPIRVYRPDALTGHGALLYFHGGGFVIHNIASHDSICRKLCRDAGVVVINVGYRLAPEAPFPAAPEDAYRALCWVHENAEALGIDGSKLAVMGDSSGANLSAVAAQLTRDRKGPPLRLQILCYAPTGALELRETQSLKDFGHGGYVLSQPQLDWFYEQYLSKGADPDDIRLNPGRAKDLSGLAPALCYTAEFDPLRDDGEAYAALLSQAVTPVKLRRVSGMMHGFLMLWEYFDTGRATLEEIAGELKAAFQG